MQTSPGRMKASPPASAPSRPRTRQAQKAEDSQLGGGRPGQRVARRDGVLELLRVQPPPAFHAQLPQQRDMHGRPAEPDATDPPPLTTTMLRPAWSCPANLRCGQQEADPGPQLGRHPAERGFRVLLAGRVGDAPVDQLRMPGKLRADLADPIAQRDHVANRCPANSARCLDRRSLMSMPCSRMTRLIVPWSGLMPAPRFIVLM